MDRPKVATGVATRPTSRLALVIRSAPYAPSTPCAQGIAKDEVLVALKVATAVATAAPSNCEKVVGADGFEPPTSCSQSIDEGAELPSFWDALTGETVGDRERWLPRWLPPETQPVKRLIRNQQVSGSSP